MRSHFHSSHQMTTPRKKILTQILISHKMSKLHVKTIFLVLLFLHIHVSICNGSSVLGINSVKTSELAAMVKRGCGGKMSECPGMADEEDEMDSESNRRVLAMQKRYISYGTLKRDLVPCTKPGASYYDCRGGGQANHYHRGCEEITRCARQVNDINS